MSLKQTNHTPIQKEPKKRNELLGKVVLLVGNDTAELPNLINQLAQKGANIALLCRQMPQETVGAIKESVHSFGQHLLLIDQTQRRNKTNEQLIDTITNELGSLDVFIDLSAQEKEEPDTGKPELPGFNKQSWPLTQLVLEKLAVA